MRLFFLLPCFILTCCAPSFAMEVVINERGVCKSDLERACQQPEQEEDLRDVAKNSCALGIGGGLVTGGTGGMLWGVLGMKALGIAVGSSFLGLAAGSIVCVPVCVTGCYAYKNYRIREREEAFDVSDSGAEQIDIETFKEYLEKLMKKNRLGKDLLSKLSLEQALWWIEIEPDAKTFYKNYLAKGIAEGVGDYLAIKDIATADELKEHLRNENRKYGINSGKENIPLKRWYNVHISDDLSGFEAWLTDIEKEVATAL